MNVIFKARTFAQIFLLSLAFLSGCASLDPDGEWRGTPEARMRSCQALLGAAFASEVTVARNRSGAQCASPTAVDGTAALRPVAVPQATDATLRPESQTVDRAQLAAAAEAAYGQGRHRDATALLDKLIAVEPENAAAWLRRANALHRLDQWGGAADSYRRAFEIVSAASSSSSSPDPSSKNIRSKASANLAILGIEQARRFLDALGAEDSDPVAAEHRARIEEAFRTLFNTGRMESRSSGATVPRPGGQVSQQPADLPASARASLGATSQPVATAFAPDLRPSGANASDPAKPVVELIRGLTAR